MEIPRLDSVPDENKVKPVRPVDTIEKLGDKKPNPDWKGQTQQDKKTTDEPVVQPPRLNGVGKNLNTRV